MPVDTRSVDGPLGFSYDLLSSDNITIDNHRWAKYLYAHIHCRFRHAHHKTKNWLSGLGSRGR